MKKILNKIILPIICASFFSQSLFAETTAHYCKINIESAPVLTVDLAVFVGKRIGAICDKLNKLDFYPQQKWKKGEFHATSPTSQWFTNRTHIDENSCAIEEYYVKETGKMTSVRYNFKLKEETPWGRVWIGEPYSEEINL